MSFFGVLLSVALVGACLTAVVAGFGRLDTLPHLAFVASGRAPVVIFGNSVNRTRSHCDTDTRDLASMLGDALGERVVDLSGGGMRPPEHIIQARLLVQRGAVRRIILPAIESQIDNPDPGTRRARARTAGYALLAGEVRPALALLPPLLSLRPSPKAAPKDGVAAKNAARSMQAEKNGEACPETDALDMEFLRSRYRARAASVPKAPHVTRALRDLIREAQMGQVGLTIYQPPVPLQLMAREGLHDEVGRTHHYLQQQRQRLRDAGAQVADLHNAVPIAGFTDRWCACGHLNAQGRLTLAEALAEALATQP